jgi:DNA repair exonuclease SbcCD ATPase subunit
MNIKYLKNIVRIVFIIYIRSKAMNKDNIQIAVDKAREHFEGWRSIPDDHEYWIDENDWYCIRMKEQYEKALSLQADRIKELEESIEVIRESDKNIDKLLGKTTYERMNRIKQLEAEKKELEDDKKKLVEDWEELDCDCMILHDKNKQLKKEKAEIIDKVVEVIKKMPIFFENEFSEWLEELINQIRKV